MISPKRRMRRIAVYPGTFDPLTKGHLNIIERSAELFDEVIVSIATNLSKAPLFSIEERVQMVRKDTAHIQEKVKVEFFDGLLIDFAKKSRASVIVRGLRPISDFEYEFQLSTINAALCENIETVFLPSVKDNHFISSSIVKEVARLKGDASNFVSPFVKKMLSEKFANDLN